MIPWVAGGPGMRAAGSKYKINNNAMGEAMVKHLQCRLDINTLHREAGRIQLAVNEIGRVRMEDDNPDLLSTTTARRQSPLRSTPIWDPHPRTELKICAG
jgi:sulfate adenylyltransferase subunit 1 (EFTu-like GTPase family)